MADYIETDLKKMLDEGHTLIEARKEIDVDDCLDKQFRLSFDENFYPDDYFDDSYEGIEFFKLKNIRYYKTLPQVGLILKDGTIFSVKAFHIELTLWLKYNGVDITNSLRYVYFPDTKRLSIIEGYDYEYATDENDINKLCERWKDIYEGESLDTDLVLTDPQAFVICKLADYFGLDRDEVFTSNNGFRMCESWQVDPKRRKVGRDNWATVDQSLKRFSKGTSFVR